MARRRARSFSRGTPGTKQWFNFNIGQGTIVASADKLLSSLNAAALAARPFTILRTHMEILIRSDQAAVDEQIIGAYGVGVVSENASSVGITGVPNPQDDTDYDWFVHQGVAVFFKFFDSSGFQGDSGHHYTIDSKSMRKVGANDDIVLVWGSGSAVGAIIVIQGRMLVQLH